MSKLVYIIILNWNGWMDSVDCIRSCQALTYPRFEVLLVDNGSSDDSVIHLRQKFPGLKFIENQENLGFAGGNNPGTKYALDQDADYIWLLNNDTQVDPEALSELIRTAEADAKIGMVGSKILILDRPDTLHFAGGTINLADGITTHIGAFEKDVGQYDQISRVDYATGCSLLVKREVIEKIGLMSEDYFLYYEETDWCLRAQEAGYEIHMAPKSKIFHKISGSIEYTSPLKQYYLARNRLHFLKKHGRKITWSKRIKSDAIIVFRFLRYGQLQHAKMVIRGYLHWYLGYFGPLQEPDKRLKP
jgi:GT2 family glycosyltransferase